MYENTDNFGLSGKVYRKRFAANPKIPCILKHPEGGPVNIAEIEFLGPQDPAYFCTCPTLLPVFVQDAKAKQSDRDLFKINGEPIKTGNSFGTFDGDMETYSNPSRIAVFFDRPALITHVEFAPRTANNQIVRGDHYQLFYHDNGWKNPEIQEASDNYFLFKNIPSGTLYWLKNLDNGKEEQPFFYENGKQLFLHIDKSGVSSSLCQ
jgi:hypothetical protein